MRHALTSILILVASATSGAVTTEETTKSDGSHTVATRILDIAFGPNKETIAFALFLLGAFLCGSAVWLAAQGRGTKSGATSQLSLSVPQKLSLKAFFGFPALLLIVGAILALAGMVLSVSKGFYSATI